MQHLPDHDPTAERIDFAQVLKHERAHIAAARAHYAAQPACDSDHAGLALSGGGIRSAVFGLGVLQALARSGYLRQFDYLSTVSGGSYIGGWLSAWINRRGYAAVLRALADTDEEAQPLQYLRRFSNYLTPQLGLLSSDFWTAAAIYLRNTLLNQAILIPALMLLMLLPWLLVLGTSCDAQGSTLCTWARSSPDTLLLVPALALITLATAGCTINAVLSPTSNPASVGWRASVGWKAPVWWKEGFAVLCISLVFMASLLLCLWMQLLRPSAHASSMLRWAGVGFAGGSVLAATVVVTLFVLKQTHGAQAARVRGVLGPLFGFAAGTSAALFTLGLFGVWTLLQQVREGAYGYAPYWFAQGIGVVLVALVLGVAVVFFFGLMGRLLPESLREWQARFGAWLLMFGGGWLAMFLLAFVGPAVFATLSTVQTSSGFVTWAGTTGIGTLIGSAKDTGALNGTSLRERLIALVPVVFIIGLLGMLSLWTFKLLMLAGHGLVLFDASDGASNTLLLELARHNAAARELSVGGALMVAAPLLVLFAIMSWRVDVNIFSLHAFYRNRLSRGFLGASNTRRPNALTGFDARDDIGLADLCFAPAQVTEPPNDPASPAGARVAAPMRPLHILNATLNLTKSNNLAWQERMAASFAMTPFYCGYGLSGSALREAYAHTGEHRAAAKSRQAKLHLGTAMAISGAAASPNMGYHTTPALAFLMAMFNLRLGWWMPNPRLTHIWREAAPTFSSWSLFKELLAQTDERSDYVFVSDGGHFENMGLYELIRRRCRFIVACDAEGDPDYQFKGMGEAIRKCRIDFSADIDIDLGGIGDLAGIGQSQHFAVGTIRYAAHPDASPDQQGDTGLLLYIKASIFDSENLPADIRSHARANTAFPHETTADQWFSESQFESYRMLGQWIAGQVFVPLALGEQPRTSLGELLADLYKANISRKARP